MTKHYVAYHNVDRMERPLSDGDPTRVISKSSFTRLLGHTVWMIVGQTVEGAKRKRFTLGCVFLVNDVGDAEEGEFKHYARGTGNVFKPAPVLNDESWFDEFRLKSRSFEGVQPIAEGMHLAELKRISAAAGYVVK